MNMAVNYDLNNTGPEVQEILDQVPVTQTELQQEVQNREVAVLAEKERAEGVEHDLSEAIVNEVEARAQAVNGERERAEGVEQELRTMIETISGGASVSLLVSPSVIYKNVSTDVTISSIFSGGTPTSISIKDGDTEIATTAVTIQNVTTSTDKIYNVTVTFNGIMFDSSATLYARYPIYYGFGVNAAEVGINANRYGATITAAHTYSGISPSNGQYFFILVPSDISGLSQFSMGGAPFVMAPETTTTINGVIYKVYKSGNSYNIGTTLSVEAK